MSSMDSAVGRLRAMMVARKERLRVRMVPTMIAMMLTASETHALLQPSTRIQVLRPQLMLVMGLGTEAR